MAPHNVRLTYRLRLSLLLTAVALVGILLWPPLTIAQGRGGVLRIGMTAADIPYTSGQPDQGGEGYRFVGHQLYDALINWDLTQGDHLPQLVPGLAESWEVSKEDNTRWIVHLRRGVIFHTSARISTSGSGQMLPLSMNEFIQENLRAVGIDLELIPIEWNALIVRWRKGFHDPENPTLGAMNVSYEFIDPFAGFTRRCHSGMVPPKSTNVMPYINPEVDRLIEAAELEFDLSKQNVLLARVHEIIVEDAPWVFVVHDLNPRALSAKVKGFVQAQSWYQDLTPVWVEK
jgi:ABC-type transport system substrate-binding protein